MARRKIDSPESAGHRYIEFSPLGLRGYWPGASPYTTSGTVEGCRDRPLDGGGTRQIEGGGEISCPDGPESRPAGND